eukprot:CAMPEP_0194679064 /NCGR_PEP_ID=MMETSP0295-20121207/10550_1 /TAXON_ID=39354 /ORGANISM="Heterosigma akashiwo, Strain CCMP2393" /LENGTH=47 /DNA_ID= /DNA_START= /DNA_END= /DNA_ORIENTATION=
MTTKAAPTPSSRLDPSVKMRPTRLCTSSSAQLSLVPSTTRTSTRWGG